MNFNEAKKESNLLSLFLIAISKNAGIGITVMLTLILVFSALLALTPMADTMIPTLGYTAIIIGSLAGGFLTSRDLKTRGIVNGLASSLIILIAVLILKLILGGTGIFSIRLLLCAGVTVISGIIGGIIGINQKRKRK